MCIAPTQSGHSFLRDIGCLALIRSSSELAQVKPKLQWLLEGGNVHRMTGAGPGKQKPRPTVNRCVVRITCATLHHIHIHTVEGQPLLHDVAGQIDSPKKPGLLLEAVLIVFVIDIDLHDYRSIVRGRHRHYRIPYSFRRSVKRITRASPYTPAKSG